MVYEQGLKVIVNVCSGHVICRVNVNRLSQCNMVLKV